MKRSHAIALSSAALFLTIASPSHAQSLKAGQQCVPAVANSSMYQNCRLRVVQGQEVCRCAIRPQALRRIDRQSAPGFDDTATGSIGSRAAALPAAGGLVSRDQGVSNGGALAAGSAGAVSSGATSGRAGSMADNNSSGYSGAGALPVPAV
jgi:hypothetical protein